MRIARTIEDALADIASGELGRVGPGVGFEDFKAIVGFPRWAEMEVRYGKG